jgi:hypothetical protein
MADLNKIEITADDIIEAYGDYYVNEGQNMENLHMLPFEESETQTAGLTFETEQTVIREANVEVQEILQQYQTDFTSKGGVEIVPVFFPLFQMKIDVGIYADHLKKSWLGFLTTNKTTPEEYPIVKWIVEVYLVAQAKQDIEKLAIYKGIYEAPAVGVAGEGAKAMNGIEKILNDFYAAGDIDPIVTGDLDAMSAVAFVTAIETS